MRYAAQVEYDSAINLTSVRGVTTNLLPYGLELFGANAERWSRILLQSKFTRKAVGPAPKRPRAASKVRNV